MLALLSPLSRRVAAPLQQTVPGAEPIHIHGRQEVVARLYSCARDACRGTFGLRQRRAATADRCRCVTDSLGGSEVEGRESLCRAARRRRHRGSTGAATPRCCTQRRPYSSRSSGAYRCAKLAVATRSADPLSQGNTNFVAASWDTRRAQSTSASHDGRSRVSDTATDSLVDRALESLRPSAWSNARGGFRGDCAVHEWGIGSWESGRKSLECLNVIFDSSLAFLQRCRNALFIPDSRLLGSRVHDLLLTHDDDQHADQRNRPAEQHAARELIVQQRDAEENTEQRR